MNDHHPAKNGKQRGLFARIVHAAGKSMLLLSLVSLPISMSSCTTDAYGNSAVTPGGAAAIGIGAAAAGAITAAAISNHNDKHHGYRPPPPPHHHHRPPHHRRYR